MTDFGNIFAGSSTKKSAFMRLFYSKVIACLLVGVFVCSCVHAQNTVRKTYVATLQTATDAVYPHNNMIGFKSKLDGRFTHRMVLITENAAGRFDFTILPGNADSDTLYVKDVDLLEFMPSIPDYVKKDPYLSYLAVLNQEWNRIQVRFNNKLFQAKGLGTEQQAISRVDIANNCLAKGLWEILAFTTENGNDLLYFQCWFDFPEELYNRQFFKRNGVDISKYDDMLKNYSHRKGEPVNLNALRKVNSEIPISFVMLNQEYYPLKGERETKLKNIIFPGTVASINDFLTDNTTYATFAAPGQYTRTDPRKTQLSHFQQLQKAQLLQTTSANAAATTTSELQLFFADNAKKKSLRYVIGGLQLDKLPVLNAGNLHKGWQRPMGIGNHSFYSAYDDLLTASSAQNPYFSFLLDENGQWLDSHEIGIDGILMYRDEAEPAKVHALILSFERHSFVGHLVFDLPSITPLPIAATTTPKPNDEANKKLTLYGDMRSRLVEHDWNVTTQDGKTLDPRTRLRLRLRFGFNYQYSPALSFGGRIRSGSSNEQQSPHITLGSNESANIPIGLDRAFIRYSSRGFTAWMGKHTFPFYTHDDLFVTSDISPEGFYASYEYKAGSAWKLKPAVAYFIINSTGKSFRRDRTMKAMQLHANYRPGKNELNLSTGLFVIDSMGNTPDGTQTFLVNYQESFSSLRFTYGAWKIPVSIAGNVMLNLAKLNDNTNVVGNDHQNETTGYSATFEIGKLKAAKDYLLSVTYAHVEKYSVLDYFAQDDWMRWGFSGGAGGTRGSNFKGLELRAAYAFGPNLNLVARTYLIKGIAPNKPEATLETNNRFRLDLNVAF